MTSPGRSHHGVWLSLNLLLHLSLRSQSPIKQISMGATAIDKDTYMEYIRGLRQLYSAERCNSRARLPYVLTLQQIICLNSIAFVWRLLMIAD